MDLCLLMSDLEKQPPPLRLRPVKNRFAFRRISWGRNGKPVLDTLPPVCMDATGERAGGYQLLTQVQIDLADASLDVDAQRHC